jgi:hypothetical protein
MVVKTLKTHGIKSSIFLTLTIYDNKKFKMTIFYGNKKFLQLSKMHFNTIYGNSRLYPSEGISKKFF